MNLMFYNFNDFNNSGPPAPNGRRPTAGVDGRRPLVAGSGAQTQGGMRT